MSEQYREPLVIVEHLEDGVARLTLNRVKQRNAMSQALRTELIETLSACRGRARAIILTGNGPSFCAGIDLKERFAEQSDGLPTPDNHKSYQLRTTSWKAVQNEIMSHPAVIIASVNGFALGGGSTLINVCDLAIAADTAEIGMPEMGFGQYPGLAGPAAQFRIAHKHAAYMIFTAERIDGKTAEAWGMVNQSVPAEQLAEASLKLARKVAQFDATTLEWSKKAMVVMPHLAGNLPEAFDYGLFINQELKRQGAWNKGMNVFTTGGKNPGQGS
ncbi:enoyl-CoA hydratase/isomerase family protein [Tardiphaga sp. 619_E2_N8_5]|uniref:enoyl-CoA hydratase/isomerase family protein n=1 Tax=unclassified Tardiphaga TaxID=2631404 RepID=UPI003F22C4CA